MADADTDAGLCDALEDLDTSLGFLLLLTAATLLSLWALATQRKGLCLTLQGQSAEAAALPPIFPLRCRSSALVVGGLGFFLCLALKTLRRSQAGTDPVAHRSAQSNVLSSVLVLGAALLRLEDIWFVEARRPTQLAEDTLPD